MSDLLQRRLDENSGAPPSPGRIAIIGMHVKAPGAPDVDAFWEVVRQGRETVSFFSEQELDANNVSAAIRSDPRYVAAGSTLPGIDRFDAAFFSVSPAEAQVMDPQMRLLLEAAWNVIEHAGYNPRTLDVPVGVYAGAGNSTYLLSNLFDVLAPGDPRSGAALQFNQPDALSTFISYKLDLMGPSVAVQTNCSTSLVAVHLACQGLRLGECDMAIAGGVSINVHQSQGYLHEPGLYFSPDGHTRPFDAGACGTIFGSGLGLVVLKRLEDAIRDRDFIHATILGSALSNDGAVKSAFTAPNVAGQARAIESALAQAGVSAESIGYLEAHGTGTPLGDSIEIRALTRAFRKHTARRSFCCLGSAKANFGHLDKAAGIIGLIKACLVVQHAELPPLVNFHHENPHLKLAESPFYVRTDPAEWHNEDVPRRAGISAFGIGGTNAHVILEQAPDQRRAVEMSHTAQLLTWSARTASALESLTDSFAVHLNTSPSLSLADVAFVGHVGRVAFPYRRALVADSPHNAAQPMQARDGERIHSYTVREDKPAPQVVFLFPGAGSTHPRALRGIFCRYTVFRQYLERAHSVLEETLGIDFLGMVTSDPGEAEYSPDSLAVAMVTLFAIDYALARLLMSWGIQPVALAGHSLGEYVAACLAGVLQFEDALSLVVTRAQLMSTTAPGAMIAVLCGESEISPLLGSGVYLAAVNAPQQCVLSVAQDAVTDLEIRLTAASIDFQRLDIAVASHSPMMRPIVPALTQAVAALGAKAPTIPLLSGTTGTWMTAEDASRATYWGEHLTRTVRFNDCLQMLAASPSHVLVEVSTGIGLADLATSALSESEPGRVYAMMRRTSAAKTDDATLLEGLGALWARGVVVDWTAFHHGESPHRIPMPTYPFDGTRHWMEARQHLEQPVTPTTRSTRKADPADWFYIPSWKQSLRPSPPSSMQRREDEGHCILLFVDATLQEGKKLERLLLRSGVPVIVVHVADRFEQRDDAFTVRIAMEEDFHTLFAALQQRHLTPLHIVHCLGLTMPEASRADVFQTGQESGFYSVLALLRAVARRTELIHASLSVVTRNAFDISGDERARPERCMTAALCHVASQEYPTLLCRNLDIDSSDPSDEGIERALEQLAQEILSSGRESVVALRGQRRWLRIFEQVRLESDLSAQGPWRAGGVYLITGGMGRVGLSLAEHILGCDSTRIVLLGRNLPVDSPKDLAGGDREADTRFRAEYIRRLRLMGKRVLWLHADAADADAMTGAIATIRLHFGSLNGVVHAAGLTDGRFFPPLQSMHKTAFEAHFQSKVYALYVLEQVIQGVAELEFCLLLSSLSGFLGGVGHAAYASANAFMSAFGAARAHLRQPRWIVADSELWSFEPMSKDDSMSLPGWGASLEGLRMTPGDAHAALDRILLSGSSEIAVSTSDLNERYHTWAIGQMREDPPPAPAAVRERSAADVAFTAPRTSIERAVAETWSQVLGLKQISIDDNFFRLGGHSIAAIRIVARLRENLHAEVSVADLFMSPTIAELGAIIESTRLRRSFAEHDPDASLATQVGVLP